MVEGLSQQRLSICLIHIHHCLTKRNKNTRRTSKLCVTSSSGFDTCHQEKLEQKSLPCSKIYRRPQRSLSIRPAVPWRSWCELWPWSSPERICTAAPTDCLGILKAKHDTNWKRIHLKRKDVNDVNTQNSPVLSGLFENLCISIFLVIFMLFMPYVRIILPGAIALEAHIGNVFRAANIPGTLASIFWSSSRLSGMDWGRQQTHQADIVLPSVKLCLTHT